MAWNWERADWPHFTYNIPRILPQETQFLIGVGGATAHISKLNKGDHSQYIVEILSQEGTESSKIEGEILDRDSLQSSIKRHFGLKTDKRERKKEAGMAEIMCNLYETYNEPLTHEMLWKWHAILFHDQHHIDDRGKYRSHPEPMQIVSRRYGEPTIYFEAPPSERIHHEMDRYISWYNSQNLEEPILGRAAIAHVYFESIHPFEDGNGRIGRLLIEKMLSQRLGRPVLLALSQVLERRKREYYQALGGCNRSLEADGWVAYLADAALQAEQDAMKLLYFLINKSKMMKGLEGKINERQEKVLLRIFECGPSGFKGGLSAEKYIAITKTSRATATRDLTELVKLGALVKTGELRHSRYWLPST